MNGSGSGLFIVVEGPEGAGKSTLVRWLAARLRADGRRVVAVRQPGGTPVAEAARKLALRFPHAVAPAAELFLFLAARADLVHHVIRPALEEGQVVVADRFDLSTIAYQVAGGGLPSAEVAQAIRLATGGWLLQREAGPTGSVYQQARLFEDVLAHVADYYVDSLDERRLYQMAIDGLLDELHDPYSVFLKPDDFRLLSEQTTGNYGGLGIQIDVRDGWITVVAPLPETPAERAGIQTGDRIVALDGRPTEGWKNDQAVKELRGQPGTTAELKVHRVGVDQPLVFKVTRATIHVRSVNIAMMLDDRVGYIALSPVSETSAAELTEGINGLLQKGMKSLILDLRGNPGGLLDQGIAATDLFLDPGQEVVATRGRAPNTTRTYRDAKPQPWPKLPIVVLVNGGTASAAEIITGALQDHDRALVVGTPTFGKGLVQSLWQLTPETALKLTTAR